MEGTLHSAGNGDKYEEQTPESRKAQGKKHAGTIASGKQQQKYRETIKPSNLLGMPIDVLYGVCRSLLCSCVP